jgi:hypothetical protein
MRDDLPQPPGCADCDCAHDGTIPGFDLGECSCHRIGGSLIMASPHDYRPSGVEAGR